MAEGYDFLRNVDNGFVTGTVDSSDTVSAEMIQENGYGPGQVSEHSGIDYDVSYTSFSNDAINADEVRIDRDLGIVDVFRVSGGNAQLDERYTFLGALQNGEDTETFFGKDFEASTEVLTQKNGEIGNWGPNLAAAYEALEKDIGIDTTELKDQTTVSLKEQEDNSPDYRLDNYNEIDVISDIKVIDAALGRLSDPAVEGLADFEANGEATVTGDDHPFSSGGNGARGYDAARNFKHKFGKLKKSGVIGYGLESLDNQGDSSEVTLSIDDQYTNNEGIKDDIMAVSDINDPEELVAERFIW